MWIRHNDCNTMIAIGTGNTQHHRPHGFEPTNRTESINQQKGYSHA
jgi:hypothetical protein